MTDIATYQHPHILSTKEYAQLYAEIGEIFATKADDLQQVLPMLSENSLALRRSIQDILNREASNIVKRSSHTPSRLQGGDYCIYLDANIQINIGIVNGKVVSENPCIFSLPSDLIVMVLGGDSMSIVKNRIPQGCDRNVFDSAASLTLDDQLRLSLGDMCLIKAREVVPAFGSDGETLVLKIFSLEQESLFWAYSRDALNPLFVASVSNDSSRLQAVCRLLKLFSAHFGTEAASIQILEKIAAHKDHFVRWTAIQHLFELDQDRGLPFLKAAQNDEHPHIRRAAQSSWARIFNNK